MSIRRCLSALACTCTSVLGVAGWSGPASARSLTAGDLSLEIGVARSPEVYLVLDSAERRLEIKARGMVLDQIAIDEVLVLLATSLLGGDEGPRLDLPALWRVVENPTQGWRRLVAPQSLRPYSADEVEPLAAATPLGGAVAALPDDYLCVVDSGWQVRVCADRPGGFWTRVGARLVTGWARLWRRPQPPPPPTLVLVMAREDGRRLCHLLRPPTALLILAPQRGAAQQ